ncbi:MAG: DUF2190 family protein [Planctomycetota bacterium]
MKNKLADGQTLTIAAPAAGVTSGVPHVVRSGNTGFVGVPVTSGAENEKVALNLRGVFELTSDTGTAYTQGDLLYWDDTNKRVTKTATSNTLVGFAAADKTSAATIAEVNIFPR